MILIAKRSYENSSRHKDMKNVMYLYCLQENLLRKFQKRGELLATIPIDK
jgi:hypothetical protein